MDWLNAGVTLVGFMLAGVGSAIMFWAQDTRKRSNYETAILERLARIEEKFDSRGNLIYSMQRAISDREPQCAKHLAALETLTQRVNDLMRNVDEKIGHLRDKVEKHENKIEDLALRQTLVNEILRKGTHPEVS